MLSEVRNGVVIDVKVHPRSSSFSVEIRGGIVVVHCKNDAKRGRANAEVVSGLSRMFGTPVRIFSGKASPRKRIMIPRMDTAAAMKILEASSVGA